MDAVIHGANYVSPTAGDEEFHRTGIFSRDLEEISAADAVKAFDALAEKLRSDRWPQRCDNGYMMLTALCHRLRSCTRDVEESEMVEVVTPHILRACESCVVVGLPASLIDIMKDLLVIIPDAFFKDMPRERFLQVLHLIRAGRYRAFADDEQADYASRSCYEPVSRALRSIEKETYHRYMDDVTAACDYVMLQMLHGDGDAAQYFDYILYCFRLQCGDCPLAFLRPDCSRLIEYLGAYQDIIEQREITPEKTQKAVGDCFHVLYTLMRSEAAAVGGQLAPFVLGLIPRQHALEQQQEWMRRSVNSLVGALRISDKEKEAAYKGVGLASVLPLVRAALCTVDAAPPEWPKEVEDVFSLGLLPFARTPQDCQLLLGVFADYLGWRSKEKAEQVRRQAQQQNKAFRAALQADVGPFRAMVEQYCRLTRSLAAAKEEDGLAREVRRSVKDWLRLAQAARVTGDAQLQRALLSLLCDAVASGSDQQAGVGREVAPFVAWDAAPSLGPLFAALRTLVTGQAGADWESIDLGCLMADVLGPLGAMAKKRPALLVPHMDQVGPILDACLGNDLYFDLNGSDIPSFSTHVLLNFFTIVVGEVAHAPLIHGIYPRLIKAIEASVDYADFHQAWQLMAMGVAAKGEAAEALCRYTIDIVGALDDALEAQELPVVMTGAGMLANLCREKPLAMAAQVVHLRALLKRSLGLPALQAVATQLLQGFDALAKQSDEVLTADLAEVLMLALRDPMLLTSGLSIMEQVVQKAPQLLAGHMESLLATAKEQPPYAPALFNVFERIAETDQSQVEPVMAALQSAVNPLLRSAHPTGAVSALVVMRRIGLNHPAALVRRKAVVEAWKGEPVLHDTAVHLLDVIANRSLEGVDAAVTEQREAVAEMDSRLQDTEDRVSVVNHEVTQHAARLDNAEERADEMEARVEVVEQDVDEMGHDIEELDNKTMTNAPKWSRQVSALLNPESDHDWRLLAQRLGYAAPDIRGWATQHDPCMAVLSEWYSTNRTAGATHAVQTALREMNRLDALALVEAAVEGAEGVVADGPEEFARPPAVFLSYQWGHQPEAKLLRAHLERAGYRCWMDVGSMGGGDKLYEAIDRGLRGSEVLVACVTGKYAQSENCRRELNLAASINKPIIPLQMERMQWPPAGPMGPLLAEYLFIRVFSKTAQPATAERPFWPADRFLELLMQIRLHVAPDHGLVQAPYERWWEPPEEALMVPARAPAEATPGAAEDAGKEAPGDAQPELFLSYQWGRQAQVKRLHARLTALGCSCWMDIFQMGGGDSLYDKIDRGVRACKAVVACVTPKYALSANCRKEVSLSHALRKPIIPLMLEATDWPPAGPMSMVFTELLYIAMHKAPEEQDTWEGPRTDELLEKLRDLGVLRAGVVRTAAPEPKPSGGPSPKLAAGSNTAPKPVAESNAAPKPVAESNAAPKPAAGPNAAPKPASDSNPAPKQEAGSNAAPIPAPGPNAAPKPAPGPNAAPKPVAGSNAAPKPAAESKAAPIPAPGPNAASKPAPDSNAAPKPAAGSNAAPKPAPGPNAAPKPAPGPDAAPKPAPESNAAPKLSPDSNTVPKPPAGLNATPEPAPAQDPTPKQAPESNAAPKPAAGPNPVPKSDGEQSASPKPGPAPIPKRSGSPKAAAAAAAAAEVRPAASARGGDSVDPGRSKACVVL